MKQRLLNLIIVLATSVVAIGISEAAPTFSNSVLQTDGINLDNSGTVVAAVNFSSDPVRSGTFNATNPDPNVTLNGITFTPTPWNGSNSFFNTNANVFDANRPSGTTSADAVFGLVYDSTVALNLPSNSLHQLELNLENLVVGEDYLLQMVFSSDGNRDVDVTSDGVSSAVLNYGPNNGPGIIAAEFTATSSSQLFTTNLNGGSPPQFSGFVLSNVTDPTLIPEPASLAVWSVLGMLGIGYCGWRKRRR